MSEDIIKKIKKIAEERLAICKECVEYQPTEKKCIKCGCFLPSKCANLKDNCPLFKW